MYKGIVQFIRSHYNCEEGFLPLHEPRFVGNELKYVTEAIKSTFVSSVGKFVTQFEEELIAYTGAKKAVALSNGTSALHLALRIVGVERDTEVLMQPLSFIATANASAYLGAIPHFVDVDLDTMSMSPESLKIRLESIIEIRDKTPYNKETNRRLSACVPMHTFGHSARIDTLCQICKEYNIPLVEDAAESLGTKYKNQSSGTFGAVGIYSFNGNKTITSGGGGAIVTNNEELGIFAKHLSTTAKVPHSWEYKHDHVGYNYRMPNLNAALLCAQLEKLDEFIENKRSTAKAYESFFQSNDKITYKKEPENCQSNFWLNAIQLENKEQRNSFLEFSNKAGVMTRPIWSLLNTLEMYKNSPKGDLSNAYFLEDRIVNIPSSVIV